MKRIRIMLCFVLAALTLPACSRGSRPVTGGELLIPALGEHPAGETALRVLYLNESVADRYVSADFGGDTEDFGVLYGLLGQAAEQPADTAGALSPEAAASHRILLIDAAGGELISFYYIADRNLLVHRDKLASESGVQYAYRFYAPDAALAGWLEARRPAAAEPAAEETSLSPAQLIAAVDAEKLAEAGVPVAYEIFKGELPGDLGPACRVWLPGELAGLPGDSVAVAARTVAAGGGAVDLSVTGVEMNSAYIRITVAAPADGRGTLSAAVVAAADLDLSRWFVFVDESGAVVDAVAAGQSSE